MPLRRFLPLLLLAACAPGQAEQASMHWLDRDAAAALPESIRPEIKPWCEGTWFNPLFATPAETTDTVITAARSSLTPKGLVWLQGDVQIRQPERLLTASEARLDQASGDFTLSGDIEVQTPLLTLQADSFTGNTNTRQASLSGTRYALFDLPARGTAEGLEQDGEQIFISSGSYTSCPPTSDAWMLSADNIELDRETGWGEARDVVLRVQKVPVIWIPWITFPIDDRRKTGLLFPSFTTSDENGIDVSQPIYLNLHPQLDATVAPRHVEKRGSGGELETRYLAGVGEGSVSFGGIAGDRLFDDQDRKVARWQHDGRVDNWRLTSDVNYVSDDFFFKDLDTGLEITSRTHLQREGEARWYGEHWTFFGRVQSFQTIDPNIADANLPYRRLPQLNLRGEQPLAGPVYAELDTDLTRFSRNVDAAGEDVIGDRGHAAPGLGIKWENAWAFLNPSMRVYHTGYRLDGDDAPADDSPDTTVPGASLHGGIYLERFSDWFGQRQMQTLEPELFVNYIGHEDQSALPVFDSSLRSLSWSSLFTANRFAGYDRIGDDYSTTAGLTSRFISPDSGQEWLRLRTAQRRYFRDRRVQLSGAAPDQADFSPLLSDLSLRINQLFTLFAENQWDTVANKRVANRGRLSASDGKRYVHASIIQRAETSPGADDEVLQGELAALAPVHNHWNLVGRWLYDVDNSRSLETLAGLEYRSCCWRTSLLGQRQLVDRDGDGDLESDNSILFQIQLTGLGGFGDRIDTLLERSIPNYRREND